MAKLLAKSACAGLLPVTIGTLTLTEGAPAIITAILPFKGAKDALSTAMTTAHGVGFPTPGMITRNDGVQSAWSGLDQAFLIGVAPDSSLAAHAALVDQSDAWAVLQIKGSSARDVLARLCPLDLRPTEFAPGQLRRSLLGHMSALFLCETADSVKVMVFRSMAATAVHEIRSAMKGLAARIHIEEIRP